MKYSDIFDHERPWYGARSLFFDKSNSIYEERIILIRATSKDEALSKAKTEAEEYANNAEVEYVGFSDVFQLFDESLKDGVEVFSTLRRGSLKAEDYVKRFIVTGDEVGLETQEV